MGFHQAALCLCGVFFFSEESILLMWSSTGPRHTLWHHTSFIKFSVALLKDGLRGSNGVFFGSETKLCAVFEQSREVI